MLGFIQKREKRSGRKKENNLVNQTLTLHDYRNKRNNHLISNYNY